MISLEFAFLDFIQQNLRSPVLDTFMVAVTKLGNVGIIWILLGIGLLAVKKNKQAGILVLASLAVDFLLCNVLLKNMVARPRPCDLNPEVLLLIPNPTDFSFPSGHTAASAASVAALYLKKERLWKPVLILAVLMAFSRMYLYVHFPTDILGGVVCGILSAAAANKLMEVKRCRKFPT